LTQTPQIWYHKALLRDCILIAARVAGVAAIHG
jgi:hypothetical protein